MKQFEYKIIRIAGKLTFKENELNACREEQLNQLGAEGWELIQYDLINGTAVLKREKSY